MTLNQATNCPSGQEGWLRSKKVAPATSRRRRGGGFKIERVWLKLDHYPVRCHQRKPRDILSLMSHATCPGQEGQFVA